MALALGTIGLGLASRRYPVLGNYPGDALWATLVALLWTFLFPDARLRSIAAATLATSLVVETSQLVHPPWLESIRDTLLGRLVLGSGFDPFDLIAYGVGAFFGVAVIKIACRSANRSRVCSADT